MLDELQKQFDRNFAIGFFLPTFMLITLSALIINQLIWNFDNTSIQEIDWLTTATAIGYLSLAGGIMLMAVNRDLYRLMEGYGTYNPLRLFGWFEKRRYRAIMKEFEDFERKYQECREKGEKFPAEDNQNQSKLGIRLAAEFPDREELLLPTPFGNAIRSFESYPLVMYGLDPIPAWGRLLAVMPKEYLDLINESKVQVDFWVNLGLVFILLQIEYVGLAYATGNQLDWWLVGLWIVLGTIAKVRATSSAIGWGHYFKSAFDVFTPKLREALGIEQPQNRQEEFAQWQRYSRALIYRLPEHLPELELKKDECGEKNKDHVI